jgi:uncharacterized protein YyaL (SSP411 family)
MEEQLTPPRTLIIRGDRDAFAPWHDIVDGAYMTAAMTLFIPAGARELPPVLAKPAGASVNAWLCEGMTCLPAITSPARLRETLDLPTIRAPGSDSSPISPSPSSRSL